MWQYCQGVHQKWIVFEWRANENTGFCEPATMPVIRHKNVQIISKKCIARVDHDVTRNPTQNVSNIPSGIAFIWSAWRFPSWALLKMPLLPAGICSYITAAALQYYGRRNCTFVYVPTCWYVWYNTTAINSSRRQQFQYQVYTAAQQQKYSIRIRHITLYHVEQLLIVAVLQQYIHAEDNRRSRRRRVHWCNSQQQKSRW